MDRAAFSRGSWFPRLDDRRGVSSIVYVIKHGLQWKDAPSIMLLSKG
ncbi:Transposase [Granulibacter bethesdensis]|nr:Transposase [Granulibacter bethesdensis]